LIGEELPWPQVEAAAAAEKIARHTREGKVREGGREGGMGLRDQYTDFSK